MILYGSLYEHSNTNTNSSNTNMGCQSRPDEDISYIIINIGLQLDFCYNILKIFKKNLMKAIASKILYQDEKTKLVNQLHIIKINLQPLISQISFTMREINILLCDNRLSSRYFKRKVQKFINLKDVLKKISEMVDRVSKKQVQV